MIIWIICVHGWCRLEHHLKRTASNQFPTLPCWVLLCSASSHGIWESFANGASRGPDIERCFGCVPPEDVVIHVHNTGIYWVCLAIFCKEKQFFFFMFVFFCLCWSQGYERTTNSPGPKFLRQPCCTHVVNVVAESCLRSTLSLVIRWQRKWKRFEKDAEL